MEFKRHGLSNNNIDDKRATELAKKLLDNILTHLDLSWNIIGDAGAAAIAKSLIQNKSLRSLDLSKNNISDKGVVELAKMLLDNTTLTHLDLSSNIIGDAGAAAIAKSLIQNKSFTSLDLSKNKISDKGGIEIAKALAKNKTLSILHLYGNKIGESGHTALVALVCGVKSSVESAFKSNYTLTELKLSVGKQSSALISALEINGEYKRNPNVAGLRKMLNFPRNNENSDVIAKLMAQSIGDEKKKTTELMARSIQDEKKKTKRLQKKISEKDKKISEQRAALQKFQPVEAVDLTDITQPEVNATGRIDNNHSSKRQRTTSDTPHKKA